jgi:beta-lactamase regulating signal transducer with metallopeptidase domain
MDPPVEPPPLTYYPVEPLVLGPTPVEAVPSPSPSWADARLPSEAAPQPLAASWSWDWWARVAAWIYLIGSAAMLIRWMLGWLALRRLLRTAAPVEGRAASLFAEMAGPQPPRLLASARVPAPFSCGLMRPTVVVPSSLAEDAPEATLRWVFAHELAHLRRRDAWTGALFGLAHSVYFALPWFWWLRRQARLCQEYLADAAAVAVGGPPEEYAEFLVSWTAAAPPPAGACGVGARPSDLYRRIHMLLRTPAAPERRCPRGWSLAAAASLLSLAVLSAGFTFRAAAAPAPEDPKKDEPKKDETKKEEPKKDVAPKPGAINLDPSLPGVELPPIPDVDELIQHLPPGTTPEEAKKIREQMEQVRRNMKAAREAARLQPGGGGFGFAPGGFNPFGPESPQGGRLGALVSKPSATLVEQLDLPKDQGLVVDDVKADSAAAKAGLKAHDVLLEFNGKPVSSEPVEFIKQLEGVKADDAVDAVVLRKGKKETVKGLKLPEAKAAAAPGGNIGFPGNPFGPGGGLNPGNPGGLPGLPPVGFVPGGINFPNVGFGGANGVMTTSFVTNDRFTTRHQEGTLIITVTGKVADGKATTGEISVQDGNESNKYESVDKVPEKYRDKVKNLVEMSEKSKIRVEIKTPEK